MPNLLSDRPRPSRLLTLGCGVLAVATIAAACGGGGDDSSSSTLVLETTSAPAVTTADVGDEIPSSTTSSSSTTTEAPVPATMPLSGTIVTDAALANRPALAVKIDNVSSARPQAGINQADVVYEERVEGGLTRLLAVFHSQDSADLGPVRSARSTDVPLLTPLNQPLFAWSGANEAFANLIRSVAIQDVGLEAHPSVYERRAGRRSPSNLFTSTEALWGLVEVTADMAPHPAFSYRDAQSPTATGEAAAGVRVSYRGTTVTHIWSDEVVGYSRTQNDSAHVDADGVQVAPDNVVVQFVDYKASGQVDSAGAQVPEAILEGSGEVWVLMNGIVVKGTWAKSNVTSPTIYLDGSGSEILLEPGSTWVLLAEPDRAELIG
ncbi:MAG: DUF3048 domain-containing protein [Actinomycetia bacterium]|nr:DUF3048 domain-containing protein [Actinomycetes bacterium]MCP4958381.1 DUF3048 domain-containing protein [Actinomycetes bacterium]